MGVYNNNKDGTRSTIANTIQVVDASIEQFLSRSEFSAVTPNDVSANNKLVAENEVTKAVNTIPTASADLVGTIVQYVGTTTANYTNGYFYKCVSDGAVTPTYSWVEVITALPSGGTTGQVLVKSSDADYDTEWGSIKGFVREKVYTPVDITLIAGKRINNFNGNIYDESTTSIAEIPVKEGERYLVTGAYSKYLALYGLYDADDKWISLYPYNTNTPYQMIDAAEVIVPSGATTLKICGSTIGYNKLFLFKVEDTDRYSVEPISDVLYDKKWYALGDSFTFGDFTNYTDAEGKTYEESDAFDPVKGMWKTYPWHIEKRTGIKAITKLAANSMRFTNIEGATDAFSADTSIRNYTMIPNDCDYVTLAFGLNEANLTAEQIGTSADTTNATLWGAYNTVLESIITANPLVKIGIIITDAWMTQTYHDALVEIAKYWGIPYLDLKNGEQVPMMIDGELREHSTVAQSLRDAAFQITNANAHPTPKAHEYRSTVIENFLRSL